jgi:zinc/manganese transport system substrate-binding protein
MLDCDWSSDVCSSDLDWLSRQAGIPAVKLPFTVGGTEGAKDLFGLFDDTLARLLAAAAAGR